jgi:HlyD family secretion protein
MRRLLPFVAMLTILSCSEGEAIITTNSIIEAETVIVSAEVSGRVISSRLKHGLVVSKDDPLVVIDTTLIANDKEELDLRSKRLRIHKQALSTALEVNRANSSYILSNLTRARELVATNAGDKQTIIDLEHQLNLSQLERTKIQSEVQALTLEIRVLANNAAKLNEIMTRHRHKAGQNGRILEKYINTGELAHPGKPLYKISNMAKLYTYAYLPTTAMPTIATGEQIDLQVDGSDTVFKGTVTWVSPQAEFTPKIVQSDENRTGLVYRVRIDFTNTGNLKIGMPVTIHIPAEAQ